MNNADRNAVIEEIAKAVSDDFGQFSADYDGYYNDKFESLILAMRRYDEEKPNE